VLVIADILDWLDFSGFVQAVIDAVLRVWAWFRDLMWGFLKPLFLAVYNAVDAVGAWLSAGAERLGFVADYFAFANAWVPVDVFFQLIAAYSALWLAWLVYRTVKSWIPTLSGS